MQVNYNGIQSFLMVQIYIASATLAMTQAEKHAYLGNDMIRVAILLGYSHQKNSYTYISVFIDFEAGCISINF